MNGRPPFSPTFPIYRRSFSLDNRRSYRCYALISFYFGTGFFFLSIKTSCCHLLCFLSVRCIHPTQQQGRFFPSRSSSVARAIRFTLVFSCLASSIQQINSLRPIADRASQVLLRSLSVNATAKSTGNSCTRPPESFGFISDYLISEFAD